MLPLSRCSRQHRDFFAKGFCYSSLIQTSKIYTSSYTDSRTYSRIIFFMTCRKWCAIIHWTLWTIWTSRKFPSWSTTSDSSLPCITIKVIVLRLITTPTMVWQFLWLKWSMVRLMISAIAFSYSVDFYVLMESIKRILFSLSPSLFCDCDLSMRMTWPASPCLVCHLSLRSAHLPDQSWLLS